MASSSQTSQQAGKPSVWKIENESREDGFQTCRFGHLTVCASLLRSPRICEEEDVWSRSRCGSGRKGGARCLLCSHETAWRTKFCSSFRYALKVKEKGLLYFRKPDVNHGEGQTSEGLVSAACRMSTCSPSSEQCQIVQSSLFELMPSLLCHSVSTYFQQPRQALSWQKAQPSPFGSMLIPWALGHWMCHQPRKTAAEQRWVLADQTWTPSGRKVVVEETELLEVT